MSECLAVCLRCVFAVFGAELRVRVAELERSGVSAQASARRREDEHVSAVAQVRMSLLFCQLGVCLWCREPGL